MGIERLKEKYLIYSGDKTCEGKFREQLSVLLIKKFGEGPFDQQVIREIVVFSIDYYISKFKEICHDESSVRFYQQVFRFHESATELIYTTEDKSDEIDWHYIASYRRILKFILETGCEVKMINGELIDEKFKNRFESKLNELLFLGEMILTCVGLYAEQGMVEDLAEVTFDEDNLYVFSRRHHYEFIIKHITQELGSQLTKAVLDDTELAGLIDLKKAISSCFGFEYENAGYLIAAIHEQNKSTGGDVVGVDWKTLTVNLHQMFNVPLEVAEHFFLGLRLDNNNKMSLLDLACKPYNLNRYIYKPILIWNIDGNDYALIGKSAWSETFIQLSSNAIPWGKAPKEWLLNKCFKKYLHKKEDDHDKWLDDDVEKKLQGLNLMYDRNVKKIIHDNTTTDIDIQGLGEIDFIIISEIKNIIYICDCKHLLGRYDTMNMKNDYNAFSIGPKSYNETLKRKIAWFSENTDLLTKHFNKKYNNSIDLTKFKIEGIFIINTPTFYMYNSDYRIYAVGQIESVLQGTFTDKTFTILIRENEQDKYLNIEYPYFQKPTYLKFDPFSDTE